MKDSEIAKEIMKNYQNKIYDECQQEGRNSNILFDSIMKHLVDISHGDAKFNKDISGELVMKYYNRYIAKEVREI